MLQKEEPHLAQVYLQQHHIQLVGQQDAEIEDAELLYKCQAQMQAMLQLTVRDCHIQNTTSWLRQFLMVPLLLSGR